MLKFLTNLLGKPKTVAGALTAVHAALEDLEHVEQHNASQHEVNTKIAEEAAKRAADHKTESERAATVRSRIRDLITA